MTASDSLVVLRADDVEGGLAESHFLYRSEPSAAEQTIAAHAVTVAHQSSAVDDFHDALTAAALTASPVHQASLVSSASPHAASSPAPADELNPASYAALPCPLPRRVPMPRTGWSLLHSPPTVLSLGCPHLDALLDGGLRAGVTELVGEAGSAKSQLCFQLLLQVQLGLPPPAPAPRFPLSHYGLDGCGLYVTTEGRPSLTRLQQLQDAMQRRYEWMAGHDFLANVFMQEAHTVEQLLAIVEQLAADPAKVSEQRLRLVVIDSVAGLFRVDDEVAMAHSALRADAQFRLSSALRRLSHQQRVVAVVCNQVTDRFLPAEPILRSSETYRDRYAILTSGRQVLPALGLSWANCVDARLALSRRGGQRGGGGWGASGGSAVADGSEVARELEVVFAPHLPRRAMAFVVDADGVRGRENSIKLRGEGNGAEACVRSAIEQQPQHTQQQQQQQQPTVVSTSRAPLMPTSVNLPRRTAAMPEPGKNVR